VWQEEVTMTLGQGLQSQIMTFTLHETRRLLMDRQEVNAFCLKWHRAGKKYSYIGRKIEYRELCLVCCVGFLDTLKCPGQHLS